MKKGGVGMLSNILMALQSLAANKLRALLTMLGIIIGIGSVIAIETVGGSLSGSISSSMSGFGASNISVSLTQKDSSEGSGGVRIRLFQSSMPDADDRISDGMIADYRAAFPDRVAYVSLSENVGTAAYSSGEDDINLTMTGINDEYLTANEVELLYGRAIDNTKDAGCKVCYVSDLFLEDQAGMNAVDAVGQPLRLTVGGTPYTFYIMGVYRYEEDGMSMSTDSSDTVTSLYIPLDVARTMTGSDAGYQSLTVTAAAGVDTVAFLETTEDFFASYYTLNDSWTVEASSMESLISTMTEMLETVSLAISAIAAISLLVGGIGVMNIMLVSVTERTREIGTRKALGAPPRVIRGQFIIESMVICLIGGLIGVATGIGLGAIACSVLGYQTTADPGIILLVVGISMAIGIFFGYYPANKASRLDPIEALRYE